MTIIHYKTWLSRQDTKQLTNGRIMPRSVESRLTEAGFIKITFFKQYNPYHGMMTPKEHVVHHIQKHYHEDKDATFVFTVRKNRSSEGGFTIELFAKGLL